jgi:hypothetical protein
MEHVLFQHMHTVVKLADIAVRRIPSRLSSRYQHNSGFCKVNAAERGVILTKDVVEGCYCPVNCKVTFSRLPYQ